MTAGTDTKIEVLVERLGNLAEAFNEHRQEYKENQKDMKKQLEGLQRKLDMAHGGYYVIAALGAAALYMTDAFRNLISVFHRPV